MRGYLGHSVTFNLAKYPQKVLTGLLFQKSVYSIKLLGTAMSGGKHKNKMLQERILVYEGFCREIEYDTYTILRNIFLVFQVSD